MAAEPVRQRLRPGRFGKGVGRCAHRADEDLCLTDLTRTPIDDGQPLAGIVDVGLLAGVVLLAHHPVDLAHPLAVQLAEAAVLIALGEMLLPTEN